jgi:hypothetical protein
MRPIAARAEICASWAVAAPSGAPAQVHTNTAAKRKTAQDQCFFINSPFADAIEDDGTEDNTSGFTLSWRKESDNNYQADAADDRGGEEQKRRVSGLDAAPR